MAAGEVAVAWQVAMDLLPLRAGGGGGFSGGGGSSGGGGGGGGAALFYLLYLVVELLFSDHWYLGVALLVAIAVGWRFLTHGNGANGHKTIAHREVLARPLGDVAIAAITAHDPGFDVESTKVDVERWFFAMRQAETNLDPSAVARRLHPGALQSLEARIAAWRAQGVRPTYEQLAIADSWVVDARSDSVRDGVTVKVHAGAIRRLVDQHGKVVDGDAVFDEWMEDWALMRPSSATTASGDLLTHCQSCGAPLVSDLAGTCQVCHHPVVDRDGAWKVSAAEMASQIVSAA